MSNDGLVTASHVRRSPVGITSSIAAEHPADMEGQTVAVSPLRDVFLGNVKPILVSLLAAAHFESVIDPLLAHEGTPRTFTIQTSGFCRHMQGVGGWIRPHGGGYYLLPGRDALNQLAGSEPN